MKLAKTAKYPIRYHLLRGLYKARNILLQLINKLLSFNKDDDHKRINRSNDLYSSMRWRHYWCSNHVRPLPESTVVILDRDKEAEEVTVVEFDQEESHSEVGTPPWCSSQRFEMMNMDEINRLAELFIASCHEKFRIEKEDSYRMYQEMLARGV